MREGGGGSFSQCGFKWLRGRDRAKNACSGGPMGTRERAGRFKTERRAGSLGGSTLKKWFRTGERASLK